VKFQKFISRLQYRFAEMFMTLLKTQLILKGITTQDDWDMISKDMKVVFNRDTYFDELKENEILSERLNMLDKVQPFVGEFFPKNFIFKKVLKLTDKEIKDIQDELEQEPAMVEQQPPEQMEQQ